MSAQVLVCLYSISFYAALIFKFIRGENTKQPDKPVRAHRSQLDAVRGGSGSKQNLGLQTPTLVSLPLRLAALLCLT